MWAGPAVKAELSIPPEYRFDPRTGRYRNEKGRFVSPRIVYALRDLNEAASVETMQRLSLALAEGRLSAPAWYLSMQHQLRRLHVQNAALGAGGFDRLVAQDFTRIDRLLQEEMDRLLRFGSQIQAGLLSDPQILNRINMYAGTARRQFYDARYKPKARKNQIVIERRILRPAEHCSLCVYLADLGWQPYGILPPPGASVPEWHDDQCLSNCRCDMETRVVGKKKGERMIAATRRPYWKSVPRSFFLIPSIPTGIEEAGKAWDESAHPRHPEGTPVDPATGEGGGRFAPKDGSASTAGDVVAEMAGETQSGEGSADSGGLPAEVPDDLQSMIRNLQVSEDGGASLIDALESFGVKNLSDVVAVFRATPGGRNYPSASFDNFSPGAFAQELVKRFGANSTYGDLVAFTGFTDVWSYIRFTVEEAGLFQSMMGGKSFGEVLEDVTAKTGLGLNHLRELDIEAMIENVATLSDEDIELLWLNRPRSSYNALRKREEDFARWESAEDRIIAKSVDGTTGEPVDTSGKTWDTAGGGADYFRFFMENEYPGQGTKDAHRRIATIVQAEPHDDPNGDGLDGITGQVSFFDDAWTSSSNGPAGSEIQHEVSKMLGVTPSEWQRQRLEEAEKRIAEKGYNSDFSSRPTIPLMPQIAKAYYDNTQAELQRAGVKEVRLFRGVALSPEQSAALKRGDVMQYDDNVLSSWTPNLGDAFEFATGISQMFAGQFDSDFAAGAIISTVVPAERVFGTYYNGIGYEYAKEFIVIGDGKPAHAMVHAIYPEKPEDPDLPPFKSWDEAAHPRHPAGTPVDDSTGAGGGRFAPKDGSAPGSAGDVVAEMAGETQNGEGSADSASVEDMAALFGVEPHALREVMELTPYMDTTGGFAKEYFPAWVTWQAQRGNTLDALQHEEDRAKALEFLQSMLRSHGSTGPVGAPSVEAAHQFLDALHAVGFRLDNSSRLELESLFAYVLNAGHPKASLYLTDNAAVGRALKFSDPALVKKLFGLYGDNFADEEGKVPVPFINAFGSLARNAASVEEAVSWFESVGLTGDGDAGSYIGIIVMQARQGMGDLTLEDLAHLSHYRKPSFAATMESNVSAVDKGIAYEKNYADGFMVDLANAVAALDGNDAQIGIDAIESTFDIEEGHRESARVEGVIQYVAAKSRVPSESWEPVQVPPAYYADALLANPRKKDDFEPAGGIEAYSLADLDRSLQRAERFRGGKPFDARTDEGRAITALLSEVPEASSATYDDPGKMIEDYPSIGGDRLLATIVNRDVRSTLIMGQRSDDVLARAADAAERFGVGFDLLDDSGTAAMINAASWESIARVAAITPNPSWLNDPFTSESIVAKILQDGAPPAGPAERIAGRALTIEHRDSYAKDDISAENQRLMLLGEGYDNGVDVTTGEVASGPMDAAHLAFLSDVKAAANTAKDSGWAPSYYELSEFAGTYKAELVAALHDDTGSGLDEANRFVATWAETSNKSALSVALQEEAAAYFGAEVEDWQRATAGEATTGKNGNLDRATVRALVESTYENTQAYFKERGVTHLTLYRGVKVPAHYIGDHAAMGNGTPVSYRDNALASWTLSPATAADFAGTFPPPREASSTASIVLKAVVPVEQIFSTPFTGPGCLNESEFIVVGNKGNGFAQSYLREEIESAGLEGRGYFDTVEQEKQAAVLSQRYSTTN